MRLPWPFGRSASDDGASSTSGDAGAGVTDAVPASPPVPAPIPPTGAWRTLPPIQRTAGPPPVVAPAAPFLAAVPGHAPLPPIVSPLGHESSPVAPAGIVVAHPHAVPSLTSGAPLTTRQVQRHPSADSPAADSPAAAADEGSPVVARAVDAPVVAEVRTVTPPPELDLPPIRTVSPVTPAATVTPSPRPLTQASPTLAPLPVSSSRASGSPTDPGRGSRPANLALPIQASGRIPASASSPTGVPDPARPAQAPIRRFAELPVETPRPAAQRQAGATPRRAGLGAPITVPPASATAQRLPVEPAAASEPSGGHGPAEASTAAPGAADPHRGHDHGPAAPIAPRPLPVLTVARQRRDASTSGPTTPASPTSVARATPTTGAPTVSRSASTVLPTVGVRPLRPSVGASATVGPDRPAAGTAGAAATNADAPAPVLARWDSGDALPATVTSLSASPTADRVLPVQLSAIQDAPAGAAMQRPSTPAPREIVFPAPDFGGQPTVGDAGGWPVPTTLPAQPATTAPRPASPARPASTPLSLARTVAAAPTPAPAPTPAAAMPVVARIVADPASPGAPPVVQTSSAGGGIPVATFTATPIVQREEAPAPGATPERAGRSDRELDELAKQLFGRIRGQLKAEVIHEREAKGLTFDSF
ncbi:MAG TPA: hypothetical protein VIZ22_02520 [Candidatus Limnocylindrales bacterium]